MNRVLRTEALVNGETEQIAGKQKIEAARWLARAQIMHMRPIDHRRPEPGIEERLKQSVGKQWCGIGNKEPGGNVAFFIEN